ncbi:hypothetical protein DJ84_22005 [Halorubrum ezzemoulense]|nr:hypothetical protein DJ84_22005 [Halorubrum ezzemoulense]
MRIDYGLSAGNKGSKDFRINEVTVDGWWQCYNDEIGFDNCTFTTGGGPYDTGIDGYKNRVRASECHFQNVGRAVNCELQSHVYLRNCTASNITGRPYGAYSGSKVTIDNSPEVISEAATYPAVDDSSIAHGGEYGIRKNDAGNEIRSGRFYASGPSTEGFLIDSPDGARWRIYVDDSGNLQTEQW